MIESIWIPFVVPNLSPSFSDFLPRAKFSKHKNVLTLILIYDGLDEKVKEKESEDREESRPKESSLTEKYFRMIFANVNVAKGG